MAAFMQRLGSTLTPATSVNGSTFNAVTLGEGGGTLCATPTLPWKPYPRVAQLGGILDYTLDADASTWWTPVYSLDGGSNWQFASTNGGFLAWPNGAGITNISVASLDIPVPAGITFIGGVYVERSSGGAPNANILGGDCLVWATVSNTP